MGRRLECSGASSEGTDGPSAKRKKLTLKGQHRESITGDKNYSKFGGGGAFVVEEPGREGRGAGEVAHVRVKKISVYGAKDGGPRIRGRRGGAGGEGGEQSRG